MVVLRDRSGNSFRAEKKFLDRRTASGKLRKGPGRLTGEKPARQLDQNASDASVQPWCYMLPAARNQVRRSHPDHNKQDINY